MFLHVWWLCGFVSQASCCTSQTEAQRAICPHSGQLNGGSGSPKADTGGGGQAGTQTTKDGGRTGSQETKLQTRSGLLWFPELSFLLEVKKGGTAYNPKALKSAHRKCVWGGRQPNGLAHKGACCQAGGSGFDPSRPMWWKIKTSDHCQLSYPLIPMPVYTHKTTK